MASMSPYLTAGALSGIAGLLVFLAVHHVWIRPIWFILPFGLAVALLGGLATGWAYSELSPGLPPPPWTAPAIVALIAATLLPALILAELRAPMFDISAEPAALEMSVGRAAALFVGELVLTSILVGGLIGWLIGGTPRASMATALAGLVFALGPGHNIPFIGGTPGVAKEVAIMAAVIAVSAVVLVGSQSLLANLLVGSGLSAME